MPKAKKSVPSGSVGAYISSNLQRGVPMEEFELPEDVQIEAIIEQAKRILFEHGVTPEEFGSYYRHAYEEEQQLNAKDVLGD